jgi:hypothetical protein
LQFIPQREREGIKKRLGTIVDRLECARHKAGNGASDEDATLTAGTHLAPHFLNHIEGAGEVRINDVAHGIEVLVEKGVPQAMSRVGEQGIHWPALGGGTKPVHAIKRCEVGLDGLDRHAKRLEVLRGIVDRGLIGGDQHIESMFGTAFGQLVANARRSARHESERTCMGSHFFISSHEAARPR